MNVGRRRKNEEVWGPHSRAEETPNGPLPWVVPSVYGDITPERAREVILHWLEISVSPRAIQRVLNIGEFALSEYTERANAIPKRVGEKIAFLWANKKMIGKKQREDNPNKETKIAVHDVKKSAPQYEKQTLDQDEIDRIMLGRKLYEESLAWKRDAQKVDTFGSLKDIFMGAWDQIRRG